MIPPAAPYDEAARLSALLALRILDTPPEERFDRITRVARRLFAVPIALISLVDATRQWFKSHPGLTLSETPRDVSFCGHAILRDDALVVPDARRDPRFADNPLVTGEPRIRFYAGQPLRGRDALRLGTLCLIDRRPRQFGVEDARLLRDLATWSENELQAIDLSQALLRQREIEARLRAAEAQLAAALDAQTAADAELERVSAAKSEFVSFVSHEFRTALTGIQGFSEMMRDEDFTPGEMKEYAADIHDDALRLNRMISEMLDLDRMESGRVTLNLEPVDLNAIVADLTARARTPAPTHAIRLELDPGLPHVLGDRDKLTQVLANLVSNAIKYSPEGGEIRITSTADGPSARIGVHDRGIGIPTDALDRVFERFARVEQGASRLVQGTGLGLPIVRKIVQLHGGRVWAESALGQGSTFQFTVPLSPLPPAPS